MLVSRLIVVIVTCSFFSCTISKQNAIRETILDFTHRGYLSSNIFQVSCSSIITQARKAILEECRKKMCQALAENYVKNEMIEQSKFNKELAKVNPNDVSFEWTKNQNQKLKKHFAVFFPGYIVKERMVSKKIEFIYRIEKENLLDLLKQRGLPFKVQIAGFSL